MNVIILKEDSSFKAKVAEQNHNYWLDLCNLKINFPNEPSSPVQKREIKRTSKKQIAELKVNKDKSFGKVLEFIKEHNLEKMPAIFENPSFLKSSVLNSNIKD